MSNKATEKLRRKERLEPLVSAAIKAAEASASTLPSWHWKNLFWNHFYYRLRSKLPKIKNRDAEIRRARTIVWAAAHRPQHSHRLTLEFLQQTLSVLFGGAEPEEIALLDASPDTFYGEAVEWARERAAAVEKFERGLDVAEKRAAVAGKSE